MTETTEPLSLTRDDIDHCQRHPQTDGQSTSCSVGAGICGNKYQISGNIRVKDIFWRHCHWWKLFIVLRQLRHLWLCWCQRVPARQLSLADSNPPLPTTNRLEELWSRAVHRPTLRTPSNDRATLSASTQVRTVLLLFGDFPKKIFAQHNRVAIRGKENASLHRFPFVWRHHGPQ